MSLGKLLAALLVLVFLFFSLLTLLAWSVEKDLLNADAYVETLDHAGLFDLPYQMIREGDIPNVGGILLSEGPLSIVSGEKLEAIARELAPPDWLRAQLESGIRDLLAVAQGAEDDKLPALVISLRQVKERALGTPGDRALALAISDLSPCAPGQAAVDPTRDVPVCLPPDTDPAAFAAELKALLTPLVEQLPDTYRVQWQPEQQAALDDLKQAGRTLDQIRVALLIMAALNMALLVLAWLLAVRSPREWLRWTGGPLALLGGLALIAAWLPRRLVETALTRSDWWTKADLSPAMSTMLTQATLDMTRLLFRPAMLVGLLALIAGIGLLIASPLFPARRRGLKLG